jgi:hypothetical protein
VAKFQLPGGFTADVKIALPKRQSVEAIVDFVLQALANGEQPAAVGKKLADDFELSHEDAALALDRVCGGVVRAATGRKDSRPAKKTDPMAWISFERCLGTPELVPAIFPQFEAPKRKPWWRRWRS